jgi:hypothetical protein
LADSRGEVAAKTRGLAKLISESGVEAGQKVSNKIGEAGARPDVDVDGESTQRGGWILS